MSISINQHNFNKQPKRRIESANTNFTSDIMRNNPLYNSKNKSIYNNSLKPNINLSYNYSSLNEKTDNNIYNYDNNSCLNVHARKLSSYKPRWKYSYFVDKNQILNLENQTEMKNTLVDYKDIDKKPQRIVYSWSKPRMVQILEKNGMIEEEIKTHPWKYSYLFDNKIPKAPGKLLKIMMAQLSQGSNKGYGYSNMNYKKSNNYYSDDLNNLTNRDYSEIRKNTKSSNDNNNYTDSSKKKQFNRPKTAFVH